MREFFESVWSDLRHAARGLRRQPAFAAIAIVTVALGIGTTTAMFSLVDGILLRPLPYPASSQLVEVMQSYPEKGLDRWTLSQQNLVMYRDEVKSFDALAGHFRQGVTLNENGSAERLIAAIVTGEFFTVFRVKPLLGRTIDRSDDQPRSSPVAVLSYDFWQSHFGGDRAVVGRMLELGEPVQIIGVMPRGFSFPTADVELYLPLGLDASRAHPNFLMGVARLKAGVGPEKASAEATKVMWNWARTAPGMLGQNVEPRQTKMAARVTPLVTAMTGGVAHVLAILQAAVLLVLLISIGNVATLIISRGASRARELAMRTALGATGRRIVRQILTESVLLAAIGGALGVAAAYVLVRVVTHSELLSLPRVQEVSVNPSVLLFASAISAISGILFGLAPAFAVRRLTLSASLAGEKSSSTTATRRVNDLLIVAQVGLSFVLLITAGLVVKSFQRLLQTNLGFDPSDVTSITVPLPGQRYLGVKNQDRQIAFVNNLIARINAMPAITSAAVVFPAIYANDVNTDSFLVEGRTPPTTAGSETQTVQLSVSPGFFRVLRIPLLFGRDFSLGDRNETERVVIVDQALASRYWSGAGGVADAIGKRIRMAGDTSWRTIIGVVGSIRDESVAADPRPHTYFPYPQFLGSRPTVVVRSAGSPSVAVSTVKHVIGDIDPGVPIDNVHPLAAAIAQSLEDRHVTEVLLAGFAILAVLLAACGLYGVMSLYVANRYREFGIRAAIGAAPRTLVSLVMKEGVGLAIAGVLVGGVGSVVATRWLRSLLYEVRPGDPVVFALISLGLLVVAASSCYLPARRAAQSDPLVTLRGDVG